MTALPLEGIRVVDLTVVWAGPGGTALLGDLGAEVIRVEDINRSSRQIPATVSVERLANIGYHARTYVDGDPGQRPYERCSSFNWHARNKLSVTMPLTTDAGMDAFLRLIAISDVLIENNSPGVMGKLGITYERLNEINPAIIFVRMPPFGLSGPMSDYLGYGPNFNSLVGIAAMDGYEDEDPTTAGENYHMDEASPPGVAFAVMAALWERELSGRGQLLEFAQAENLLVEVGEYLLDFELNDRNPRLLGNSHPQMFQGVFRTSEPDRWVALSVCDDQDWSRLRSVVGDARWLDDGNHAISRLRNSQGLSEHLDSWTAKQNPTELVAALQAVGVPAGEVMSERRLLDGDPQLVSRDWFQTRSHASVGTHMYPGHPWRSDGFALAWGRPLPGLGEDNEYVYKDLLGYASEAYQHLVDVGLIGTTQLD